MVKKIELAEMPRKELEEYAVQVSAEAEQWKQKAEVYEEQIRLMTKKKYGASSEQSKAGEEQLNFFNEAEEADTDTQPEPKMEQVKPPRKKKTKGAKEVKLKNIAKTVTEYTLSGEEAVCPQCGSPLAVMKKTVRKEIEIIPAKVQVHEHLSYTYVCRECEKNAEHTPIIQAKAPAPLLHGALLSPSLMAFILCRKFEDRTSLYKTAEDFKSYGLKLSRQNLSHWVVRTAQQYGKQLYERMKEHLLEETYLHADETPVQVLREPGRKAESKSYMWLFANNHTSMHPIVLYHYAPSRAGDVPCEFLKGYEGILQCDGYDGYNKVKDVVRVGCLAHVRRKFVDAEKAVKKAGALNRKSPERKGVRYCNVLFALDARAKKIPEEERLAWKEKHIRKVLEQFLKWAEKEREKTGPANTAISKALKYCLNEKEYLENYFKDARIELSNNMAERAIRPFVMGRKNWLFCNTPKGADSSAVWYSLAITAKENGLLLFEYFNYIFEQLRGKSEKALTKEELDELLPWSEKIPDTCRRKEPEAEA